MPVRGMLYDALSYTDQMRLVWEFEYREDPVAINVSFDSNLDISSPIESLSGLGKAFREIYEQMQPGTEVCERVLVKDYYEYYPLFLRLELPDNTIWGDESWRAGEKFVNMTIFWLSPENR